MLSESLGLLSARGEQRRYRKGVLLIQEGDHGDTLFILLSGRVKAFSMDDRDREIVYGVYGPGEYLGEMSLDGGPRSASIITLEPTVCSVVTRHTLRQHIAERPEFAFELISRVIHRARLATHSARSLALLDVYGRVAQLLTDLAVTEPDGTRVIRERLTHQEIASRVGCSREMVSRLLKDLDAGGHIAVSRTQIVLKRPLPARW
ncbi:MULTISPECIES: Crp/Fnr family transcriptional regulator [unclassified Rhizobacter]|uniref:Crp/Fnr family transcriptional regulator n=1 Tax=unclassified Rhizobacter TaxID=2640088 RepID=UPI00181BAE6E|nr:MULTISPECIES: cyclic nucleotide-binding domain-containing protein [unclassified Rhizobacter]NKI96436.1 CRP/FNR family cyclic AMP-dependent transcriptional regulator [Rhizobacter sp. SG703]